MSDTFTALTASQLDGAVERTITELSLDDLPADGVLLDVQWSSVNYKDGLATSANGKVARISPLIPGIDLAGTVIDPGDSGLAEGLEVIAHGYDLGVSRHGGYSQRARVPADWLVPKPDGLDLHDAMVVGTAGFTAALSVVALEERGLRPGEGPVLVTGASGGVGSSAVAILSGLGHEVVASSGKADAEDYLTSIGASSVISREELAEGGKPLEAMTYAGVVDCVGGQTLATALARTTYGGAVAASGLTGGTSLPTTVLPFILRGVSLLGIDSVQTPIERRRAVWNRIGGDLKPRALGEVGQDVALSEVGATLDAILRGEVTGRVVVDVNR
jgi:putative YhdH/YhfP family quinone oxidoreductase